MRFFAFLFALLLPAALAAQERPKAILVLDGSGSMWGQIGGVAKITIAQEVVGQLLGTLPEEQELGLTVYGHRRKGDCSDIETLVLPGGDTRGAIGTAVNGIKPKGKTPMTGAVIAAAEALKYTEEKATVILVSDGIETCEPDPCAAARALEEAGVDFTAHVVGFDVANDPEALAQMQCLADETGGTFRSAENAEELAEALVVVAAEPPAPEPRPVRFRGIDGPGGAEIRTVLIWSIAGEEVLADSEPAPHLTFELLPGEYAVEALRPEDEEYVELTALVREDTDLVTLVFPELPPPPVRVNFQATDGKNGPIIGKGLRWQLFDKDGAALGPEVVEPRMIRDLSKGEYRARVIRDADGAEGEEVFGVGQVGKTIAIVLPEFRPGATIEAAETAIAGSLLDVRWTGPDQKNDYIAVQAPGEREGTWINYTYTREGPLLQLRMPTEPGDYEIRYTLNDGRKTLATRVVQVLPLEAGLEAPETATAGSSVEVRWTGPDYKNDFIAVQLPGEREGTWINYTYTRQGSPLMLEMPVEPGTYEIRYTLNQDRKVIATRMIEVVALATTLEAPDSVPAGSLVEVRWTGGDYKNDYIAFARPGEREGAFTTYTYTREGSPLTVAAPLEPGTWELRYVLSQDSKTAAVRTIEVLPVEASLEAAAEAPVGAPLRVTWSGPDYKNDYISVARVGERDGAYEAYTYTREGAPLDLQMPMIPGQYEIRYVANGAPDTVIARRVITLVPVTASLTGPAEAKVGQTIKVSWEGPDYRNDYISIARPGDNRYETYTYTREGATVNIEAPELPGTYEIRYVVNQGSTILATIPLVVGE